MLNTVPVFLSLHVVTEVVDPFFKLCIAIPPASMSEYDMDDYSDRPTLRLFMA